MLLFQLLLVACRGDASPLGNVGCLYDYGPLSDLSTQVLHQNSTTQTVSWQQEPRTRGTFRLLISCVITLSLCVWTAIHLNIVRSCIQAGNWCTDEIIQPRQHTSGFRHYKKKMRWVLMGLFAPEVVVYVAWRQYKSASVLTKSMNEIFEQTHQERKHPWTNVHSFYAGMGGFVIDTTDSLKGPYTWDSPRLSLGSRGALFVARHGGCIPDISKASIFDRSKADNVGKFLACLQAGWAIVQCTGRLASHLPLTLLEINTLGHVLCAFLMYLFWLQKPLDVNEPTVLIGEWTHPMCAWLLMSNSFSSRSKEWGIELSSLYVYPRGAGEKCEAKSGPDDIVSETESDPAFIRVPQSADSSPKVLDPPPVSLQEHEILSGTIFSPRPNIRSKGGNPALATPNPIRTINLDFVTVNRWRLASHFVSEHWNVIGIDPVKALPEGPLDPNAIDFIDLIMLEVPDWPGLDQLYGHTNSTCAKLWAATILYGGLHAGAWSSIFPSSTEALLWRISAVLIAGSGLTASVIAVIKHWKDQDDWKQTLRSYAYRFLAMTPKAECAMVIGLGEATFCAYSLTIMAVVPTFVLARVYLVVEAFISLRDLPIEAYQTSAWTQWIPHL